MVVMLACTANAKRQAPDYDDKMNKYKWVEESRLLLLLKVEGGSNKTCYWTTTIDRVKGIFVNPIQDSFPIGLSIGAAAAAGWKESLAVNGAEAFADNDFGKVLAVVVNVQHR